MKNWILNKIKTANKNYFYALGIWFIITLFSIAVFNLNIGTIIGVVTMLGIDLIDFIKNYNTFDWKIIIPQILGIIIAILIFV